MSKRNVIILLIFSILILLLVAAFAPRVDNGVIFDPLCLTCGRNTFTPTARPTLPGDETPTPTHTPTARPTLPGDATDTPTPRPTP